VTLSNGDISGKVEYKIISSRELMAHKELEEQLKKFGEEGWEAVGVSHPFGKWVLAQSAFFLKRKKAYIGFT